LTFSHDSRCVRELVLVSGCVILCCFCFHYHDDHVNVSEILNVNASDDDFCRVNLNVYDGDLYHHEIVS
jgi:hypothetical protein